MNRSRASLRQPLLIYALVFSGGLAAFILTLASWSMVTASERAYRRAVQVHTHHLATLPPKTQELALGRQPSHELSFRLAPKAPADPEGKVHHPVSEGRELVATFDRAVPMSIAFVEISRIFPLTVIGVLGFAGLFTFMASRLVLTPLQGLAEMAEQAEASTDLPMDLDPTGQSHEIVDIARRFRQTVQRLNQERAVLASQKEELVQMQEGMIRTSKLASVGRLAAGIAHEVGNPLAAVRGYMSLLKDGLPPTDQSEVVERSQRELERIHETIRKLLAYARSGEEGSAPLETTCLSQVVESAVSLARGHPALHHVEIATQLSPDLWVQAHPQRLGQVFFNLVLNGAQATGSGGHIRVRAEGQPSGSVTVSVEDDGPGVPAHCVDSIFDPFFTTKGPGEGTGLGLAVSRAMMEAMGGDLAWESSPQGARFRLVLQGGVPAPSDSEYIGAGGGADPDLGGG